MAKEHPSTATAMELITAGLGAQLHGLASEATLEAVDSAITTAEDQEWSTKLDRANTLRAAVLDIAAHLGAVDQIYKELGLTPPPVEFLSDLVAAEEHSSDNRSIPAEIDPSQAILTTRRTGSDVVVAPIPGTTERRPHDREERLQARYFEAAVARTRDGKRVVETLDELIRFVYEDEFSDPDFGTPDDIERLNAEIQTVRSSLFIKLRGKILTTERISDDTLRYTRIVDEYGQFYRSRSAMVEAAKREIPDAPPDLPEEPGPRQ